MKKIHKQNKLISRNKTTKFSANTQANEQSRSRNPIEYDIFIEYLHFETEKCFKKQARDFIVLKTQRQEVMNSQHD